MQSPLERWPSMISMNRPKTESRPYEFLLHFHEYSGLISFRIDWLDLLAVRGTLKTLLQHHGLKASVPWHSAFFMDQLSHPYMTTGEYIALALQNFVDKVMSLLFNTLPRFVIASLLRSKSLLIPWLQSPSAVILKPPKNKVRHCFPIYLS